MIQTVVVQSDSETQMSKIRSLIPTDLQPKDKFLGVFTNLTDISQMVGLFQAFVCLMIRMVVALRWKTLSRFCFIKSHSLPQYNHFVLLMILWVRNLGRSWLGSSLLESHMWLQSIEGLGWAGRSGWLFHEAATGPGLSWQPQWAMGDLSSTAVSR